MGGGGGLGVVNEGRESQRGGSSQSVSIYHCRMPRCQRSKFKCVCMHLTSCISMARCALISHLCSACITNRLPINNYFYLTVSSQRAIQGPP